MKNLIAVLILYFIPCAIHAQSTIYTYNGKCKIELPNKLELQHSELHSIKCINAQNQKKQVQVSTKSSHIIFQQKGLNDDVKEAYNKYCRVIVEYFKEDRNAPTYGRGNHIIVDKKILNAIYNAENEDCRRQGTPLIKFTPPESMTINGYPVLFYSYKRMGLLKDDRKRLPPVIVNVYIIFNKYESVKLTFAYREAEREMWKSIHNSIYRTFSFTK